MQATQMSPSHPPIYQSANWVPAPAPAPATAAGPAYFAADSARLTSPPSKLPVNFSPPLIAMVVVVATAFLVVTYSRLISRHLIPPLLQLARRPQRRWRRWRRRRRRSMSYLPSSSGGDLDSLPYDSPFFEPTDGYPVFSPYGLDESVIKTIPLSIYMAKSHRESRDCAVCLIEFEDDDYIRTLPLCNHTFHVDCIDIWLRSHANCPLCRAGIFRPESPFVPVMAARIRPSLEDAVLQSILLAEAPIGSHTTVSEITPCIDDHELQNMINPEEGINGRDHFLLKRSYSFGFERSSASERMTVLEPATGSPWRYRRNSFWSKRPSPFGSLPKARVFSFRMKSPFFRRKGFFPLSESSVRFSTGGGGSSRRTKSMTSPVFLRSLGGGCGSGAAAFSSSRLRCGDPEALLSPERFNRR